MLHFPCISPNNNMKNNTVAFVFIIAVFVLSGYGQTGSPFTSKEGRFSIVAPTGFDKLEFSKDDSRPALIIYKYSLALDRGGCFIGYYDVREELVQTKGAKKLLEDVMEGVLNGTKASLDGLEDVTLDGYPGLLYTIRTTQGDPVTHVRTEYILVNTRLYFLQFMSTDRSELTRPDVSAFFKSFKVQK